MSVQQNGNGNGSVYFWKLLAIIQLAFTILITVIGWANGYIGSNSQQLEEQRIVNVQLWNRIWMLEEKAGIAHDRPGAR